MSVAVTLFMWEALFEYNFITDPIVDYPNGEREALHHVKDAEKIYDVIRQARIDENGIRIWW